MGEINLIKFQIDKVRDKLERKIQSDIFTLVDLEVVQISQELDVLLNIYNELTIAS